MIILWSNGLLEYLLLEYYEYSSRSIVLFYFSIIFYIIKTEARSLANNDHQLLMTTAYYDASEYLIRSLSAPDSHNSTQAQKI